MTSAAQLALKARTALALGPANIARATLYRLGVLMGTHPALRLRVQLPAGPFYRPVAISRSATPSSAWQDQARYFGWFPVTWSGRACPDWHVNPFSGGRIEGSERPWWKIPDFDVRVGDIKAVWEASRFDWVLAMVQRATTGEIPEWERLNDWLEDWCLLNPAYFGPNWKCGQEASIRVMHLTMAALISGQAETPCPSLLDLVEAHLRRIAPTLHYAIAQDNNHGTSEAAALFIGGSWLVRSGRTKARHWERLGRRWLEHQARRLIALDGSFSQYSVNYHRLILDTFSMVEVWRRYASLKDFSRLWQTRAAAAAHWLAAMVDPASGDAPNLGANDGAWLLQLSEAGYRDFRPSVQLAMVLFTATCPYPVAGSWNEPLRWLGVPVPDVMAEPPASRLFDDGGFALLRRGPAMVLLRYPRFRFRPSQADALHVDLWVSGKNLLRDAGTFSYNTDAKWLNYFQGTASHNTVQFDDRDQMTRLSRFLFGDWLKTVHLMALTETAQGVFCGAGYRDQQGAYHLRTLNLLNDRLVVRDEISHFEHKAILRWRLKPGPWRLEGNTVTDGNGELLINASMPIVRFCLTQGWESRYYLLKTDVPVLEVEVHKPGVLTTEYRWFS